MTEAFTRQTGRSFGFIEGALNRAEITEEAKEAYAYVAPHRGYIYSGKTAAFTYKALKGNARSTESDTIIIIGPNHTGNGRPISVSMEDWETPLGGPQMTRNCQWRSAKTQNI